MSTDNFIKYSDIYSGITNSPAFADPRVREIISLYDERVRQIFHSVFDTALVCPGDDLEFPDEEKEIQTILQELLGKLDAIISQRQDEVILGTPSPLYVPQVEALRHVFQAEYEKQKAILLNLRLPTDIPDKYQFIFQNDLSYRGDYEGGVWGSVPSFEQIMGSLTVRDIGRWIIRDFVHS